MVVYVFRTELNGGCADSIADVNRVYDLADGGVSANQSAGVLSGVAVFAMVGVRVVFKWVDCIVELKKSAKTAGFYIFKILNLASPRFKYFNPNSWT